jgi:hypothetical protein
MNKYLENKNILYISPKFFGYEKIIKEKLENLGAVVDYFDDRPSNDFLTKVFIRLKLKFFVNKKINNYYNALYNYIKDKNYDYIFVVSPETFSFKELEIIKNLKPNAKTILYMWDSFENKNSFGFILRFWEMIFYLLKLEQIITLEKLRMSPKLFLKIKIQRVQMIMKNL